MVEFLTTAIGIAEYFEDTYSGRILPNNTRRIPPFPIRIWNQYARVNLHVVRTNNSVEGWHNGFQSGISCAHKFFQLEQSLQEARLSKWESGDVISHSRDYIARGKRIVAIATDFQNRDTITYLKGMAHNFNF